MLRETTKALEAANVERAEAGLEPLRRTFGLHPMRQTFGAMLRRAGVPEDDSAEYPQHSRGGGVTGTYTPGIEQEAVASGERREHVHIEMGELPSRIAGCADLELTASTWMSMNP